jgi:glycosyltransferase involved in cell wall biosynthesis
LAAALQELLNDETKRTHLGSAAREMFCQRLNRQRVMDSMYQTYASVLCSSRRS